MSLMGVTSDPFYAQARTGMLLIFKFSPPRAASDPGTHTIIAAVPGVVAIVPPWMPLGPREKGWGVSNLSPMGVTCDVFVSPRGSRRFDGESKKLQFLLTLPPSLFR